jgi:very-short-patch-repair endonuclease
MPTAGRNVAHNGPEIDRLIGEASAQQHGLITLTQLRALGATRRMVRVRVDRGSLHAVHRGVFSVGHPPITNEARLLAAVLACGPGALLSHRSAASLYRIRNTASPGVDVTAPTRRGLTIGAIALHRATTIQPEDRDTVKGIPVTSLPRTVIDLATCVSGSSLEYAIHRAESQRKLTPADLEAALARHPGVAGTSAVRRILDAPWHDLAARTRSRWERRLLDICRAHGLPPPEVNKWIPLDIPAGGLEVDFSWPEDLLIVEVDEQASHHTIRARMNDARRDAALGAAGWQVIRIAEEEFADPARIANRLLAILYPRPSPWRRRS